MFSCCMAILWQLCLLKNQISPGSQNKYYITKVKGNKNLFQNHIKTNIIFGPKNNPFFKNKNLTYV